MSNDRGEEKVRGRAATIPYMRIRTVALLALLALPGPLGAVPEEVQKPPKPLPGMSFRFVQTMESETPNGTNLRQIRGKVTLAKDRIRIDFDEAMGLLQDGTFVVSSDGGRTLALVRPPNPAKGRAKGAFARVDLDAVAEVAREAMSGKGSGLYKFEAREPKVTVTEDPAPVTLLGLPARKSTVDVSWALEASVQGVTSRTKTHTVADYWSTDAMPVPSLPLLGGVDLFRTGRKEVDEPVAQEGSKLRGVPLKILAKSEVRAETPRGARVTTTQSKYLASEVKKIEVEPSKFEVPDGYRELDAVAALSLIGGK